jgi:outer membrane protein
MKQFKTICILALLILGTSQVSAQVKIAHIDVSELMANMPAM